MLPFQIHTMKTIPVLVGIGIVVSTALVITYVFKKRKTHKRTLVDPTAKVSLQLIDKKSISHDTKRFRFQLPSNNHILGLPVGQHIFLTAQIDGEPVIRSYTPVSSDDDLGYMDLVVKVYMKNVHPKFPAGGKMSQYLDSLNIGDTVDIRGPSGRLKYLGNGNFSMKVLRKDPAYTVTVNKIAMIAGGTGITPMLQIIRHIIKTSDPTQMSLLFANQTEKDILLRDELEDIARNHSSRFQVWYTLDVPPPDWKYSTGFITADMIEKHLFPPSPDTLVVICGPPLMVNIACIPNLEKLGYDSKLRFAY
ncbi:NADH-cytochrome b5 reductase 1 isoform X1 [Cimex lectularius]|uniref:NADH-cytochrome b5 reductase n=1 Tax=Cimex lectularius TaxID=79782 RepID=A0A8I6RUT8_CIMLE|nr:NADH-cytochrome b5 reductase 1 isoform X1 [Cimex lectularius]XP_014250455.1 NADH-cytochrome b5 reductase 1 isoform X1 [Cimex lectularius]XP_014250456.1 NADH-cytochrome b5 reductase 1 isoform X1 [Cimex lectularius]XP_014250457.1 NADH-cytochrome b5 reductase 1 isoform X1 [Cimex lectularius]XP_024082387.1 NADH-cytochrome b5 reductase 1 isoform X1 [Cimex lectularius]XP_024082388.1 NADH-cytochrome b5 reductase 1 isoform X1 [Cimex lectularius]